MPKTYTDLITHLQTLAAGSPDIHSFCAGNVQDINSMPSLMLPMLFLVRNAPEAIINSSDILKGSNAEEVNISLLLLDAYPPSVQLITTVPQKCTQMEGVLLAFIRLAFSVDFIPDFKLIPKMPVPISSGYSQYNASLVQVRADLKVRIN